MRRVDVDGMLREMGSVKQLRRWMAYELLEPWGFPDRQRRHAQLGMAAGQGHFSARAFVHQCRVKVRRFLSRAELTALNDQARKNDAKR